MCAWENQPKITVGGRYKLEDCLDKDGNFSPPDPKRIMEAIGRRLPRQRCERVQFTAEVFSDGEEVKSIIYHKPRRSRTKKEESESQQSSQVKEFTMSDQLIYLVEKIGDKKVVSKFRGLPQIKVKQFETVLSIYRKLRGSTIMQSDFVKEHRGTGLLGDPARYLRIMQQAELLNRTKISGQVGFIKPPLDETEVVSRMILNSEKMRGYDIQKVNGKTPKPIKQKPETVFLPVVSEPTPEPTPEETFIKEVLTPSVPEEELISPSGKDIVTIYAKGVFSELFVEMESKYISFMTLFPNLGKDEFTKMFFKDKLYQNGNM